MVYRVDSENNSQGSSGGQSQCYFDRFLSLRHNEGVGVDWRRKDTPSQNSQYLVLRDRLEVLRNCGCISCLNWMSLAYKNT